MIILYDTRNELVEHLPVGLKIAELGVFKGGFSEILYKTNPECLHLVDLFEGQMSSGDKDGQNIQTVNLLDSFNNLNEQYKNDNRVKIIKGYSDKVLSTYEDNFFDFIYIDASHHYEDVKKDLEISYKKIKNGGLVSGHDYNPNTNPGIVQAVSEFLKQHDLRISGITRDALPSFLIKIKK